MNSSISGLLVRVGAAAGAGGGGGLGEPSSERRSFHGSPRSGSVRSRPDSLSSDSAIEFIGVEKSGSSTSASSSPAIQKTWLCVNSASSASTATNCICTLLVRCAMCSGSACRRR